MRKNAFSLIELSIVLIIIGLLVAGVTGGASLIQSARMRAWANEINGWKQAALTFKAAKGRFPGDRDNIGKFGNGSGYTYEKTDFAPPFDTGTFTPDNYSAPFVELYTEKISDFKPTSARTVCTGRPCSKAYPKMYYEYRSNWSTSTSSRVSYYGLRIDASFLFIPYNGYDSSPNNSDPQGINPKIARTLDSKIDDGVYNSGILRTSCWGATNGLGQNSYDDAIDSGNICTYMFYDLKID